MIIMTMKIIIIMFMFMMIIMLFMIANYDNYVDFLLVSSSVTSNDSDRNVFLICLRPTAPPLEEANYI